MNNSSLNNPPKGVLVESYSDNYSWYRVYSDGWVEQGGYSTADPVTLFKPYSNTNYSIFIQNTADSWQSRPNTITTTSFNITRHSPNNYWQTAGMGA